jgi:hypothetical protein
MRRSLIMARAAYRGEGVSPSRTPRERQNEERLGPQMRGQDALATQEV